MPSSLPNPLITEAPPLRPFNYTPPPDAPLTYLYQDDDVLVVDKPAGLLSVPGKSEQHQDCLARRIQADHPESLIIHRLDMATSGVMIFARRKSAQRHLGLQFERRHLEKTYIADVWGHVTTDKGDIDLPLICDWPNRPRQMVCHETGKSAQTHWSVMERTETHTRMHLTPHTGRSHQLRVHMLALGHPILGDRIYAHNDAYDAAPRLCLHAHTLTFRRPTGGDPVEVTSPCPF